MSKSQNSSQQVMNDSEELGIPIWDFYNAKQRRKLFPDAQVIEKHSWYHKAIKQLKPQPGYSDQFHYLYYSFLATLFVIHFLGLVWLPLTVASMFTSPPAPSSILTGASVPPVLPSWSSPPHHQQANDSQGSIEVASYLFSYITAIPTSSSPRPRLASA